MYKLLAEEKIKEEDVEEVEVDKKKHLE